MEEGDSLSNLTKLLINRAYNEVFSIDIEDKDLDKEFYELGFDELDKVEFQMSLEDYNINIPDDEFDKLKNLKEVYDRVYDYINKIGYDSFIKELEITLGKDKLIDELNDDSEN